MKRSKSLTLVLMGSVAFGGVGCSSNTVEESFDAYTSVEECVRSNVYSEEECKNLAMDAILQNPTFASQEECEAQFGAAACQNVPAELATLKEAQAGAEGTTGTSTEVQPKTTSSWMPMMMGFMAGRYMAGGSAMQGSQPLYGNQTAAGGAQTFRTAGGETVMRDASGKVSNPSPAMKQSVSHKAKPMTSRTGTGSKGGFSGSKSGTVGS